MDTDIAQLAKRMRDRRATGGAPYVLLLGSSLSLTPQVRRAVCGSEDWGTFWTTVEKMSPAERRAAFKEPLERLLLAEGYRALTRLLAAGYFEVVFTLNVDDTLDDELSVLKADEYRIWVYGEVTSAELVAALEYRSPRVKVLKLRGDVNAHKLPLTPEGQFEFPGDLENAVTQWLSRDTMVVGDLPFDDDVWRCLQRGESALWVVELETPKVPEAPRVAPLVKHHLRKGDVITAESFNAFFAALADRLEVEEVKPAWELPPQNPYQGLEAFTQDKAPFFFGRERLTEKLLERLRRERFLAVVGASGSGKSSVAQAGLLHRLAQGALPDSADWPTLVCRPGGLVDALARLLRGTEGMAADERQDLLARVPAGETAIHVIAERVLQGAPPDHRLVLVVDQFEELFTLESAEYREQVIAALLKAVRAASGRTTVVVTMRSDFYARVAEYDELFVWMEQHRVFVPSMNETELRDAIQRPARLVKFPLDDALAETILEDVGREPGALPLLQYALKELYDRWQEGLTPAQAYQQIGGVQGALEHRANEVYNEDLNNRQQKVARHILIRLTQLGERTEDTRRRATFEDLVTAIIPLDEIEEVVDILATAQTRLLVTDDPDKEQPGQTRVVEVAHEALIRGWEQLRTWLNEDRAGLLLHQRLRERTREWDDAGQHEDYLYRGLELGKAREWAEAHEGELNELEQAFLDKSAEVEERAVREEKARHQREVEQAQALAEEQRKRAEEQAQSAASLRKRAMLLAGVGAMAVILAIAAFGLWRQSETRRVEADTAKQEAVANEQLAITREAEAVAARETAVASEAEAVAAQEAAEASEVEARRQARISRAGQLAAQAQLASDRLEDRASSLSLMLARQAVLTTWITDTEVIPQPFVTIEADAALRLAVDQAPPWRMTLPRHRHTASVRSAAFSPDGKTIVTASRDGTARLWDVATGTEIYTLIGHSDWVWSAAFSRDGKTVVTAGWDGTARLWDVETGTEIRTLTGHTGYVLSAAFSSDGKTVVTASADSTARLWDVETGTEIRTLAGHSKGVLSAAFSPDGKTIVTASDDRTARLWDVATGTEIRTLTHTDQVWSAAFNPDGKTVVTASPDRTARLWDVATGTEIRTLEGHTGGVYSAAFSPDGKTVVTASEDNTARLWDAATGTEIRTLAHTGEVWSAAFSPYGKMIVTASGHTARLWDVATGAEIHALKGHTAAVTSAAFSPDGKMIVTASDDRTARLWDVATGTRIRTLDGHLGAVTSVAFSPDGKMIVTASDDRTARLWDVAMGAEIRTLEGHMNSVRSAAFSPDGKMIVTAGDNYTVRLWDVATGTEIRTLAGHMGWWGTSAAFSPDGQTIVTASGNTARLWDVETGTEIRTLEGHAAEVTSAAFSPDGEMIVTASADRTARLWDVETGATVRTLAGHMGWWGNSAAFSPDGKTIVTASADQTARLWDVATGTEIRTLTGHTDAVTSAAFSPDGKTIVTASADGTARLWDVAMGAEIRTLAHTGEVYSTAFSPDGKTVVTTSRDGIARLWDVSAALNTGVATETRIRTLARMGWIVLAAFSPDGKMIVTDGTNQTALLWDVATGTRIRTLQGHTDAVRSAAFSPDGKTVVAASGNTALLWDVATGTEIRTLTHTNQVWSAAFNPDGKTVVTASADRTARLWDVATGAEIRTLAGHMGWVNSAAFSPDGKAVVTASTDRTARLWDVATGNATRTFQGHTDVVWSAAFSPDGKTIVTASGDGTARLWDVATGTEIRTLTGHTGVVWSAAFSPDGKTIVTASADGTARLWPSIEDLLKLAESLIQREPPIFTPEERRRFGLEWLVTTLHNQNGGSQ